MLLTVPEMNYKQEERTWGSELSPNGRVNLNQSSAYAESRSLNEQIGHLWSTVGLNFCEEKKKIKKPGDSQLSE
jgi:hypothetical protein